MYRVSRKFAWWPTPVWKRTTVDVGVWKKIWWREYYIVERMNYNDMIDDVHSPRWEYYIGNYFFQLDAENIGNQKNNH